MKKLFAMLLALCMLCGLVSAGAEDATQEVELYGSRFRIPAELEITESVSGFGPTPGYLKAWCGTYELVLYARDYAIMGLDLEEELETEQILNVVYWYVDMGLDANQATTVALAHELQDIGMPDGKMIACLELDTNISIGHTDDNYGFLLMLTSYTGQNIDELLEIGKQIALSFQRDGAEESTAEVIEADEPQEVAQPETEAAQPDVGGTQEIMIDRATLQVPAELEVVDATATGAAMICEAYELVVEVADWGSVGIDLGNEIPALANAMFWYYAALGDEEAAQNIALAHTEEDIGMPDGRSVAYLVLDSGEQTMVSYSYAYGNFGLLMTLTAENGADQQALLDVCKEITLSFRLDGMTAEDMAAAAETAAAQAAEQAAAQQYIVITNESANLRTGPDVSYDWIATAYQGETFLLLGESGNWYMIEVNGQIGYVSKNLSAIQ